MASSIDPTTLVECFNMTLQNSQQAIDSASEHLEKCRGVPGFAISLVQIADNNENPIHIRVAAVTHLKLICESNWRPKGNNVVLSSDDKNNIKSNALDILIRVASIPQIVRVYESIFSKIIEYEFPNEWPNLLEIVLTRMKSMNSFEETLGSLIFFKEIIKKYEFLLDDDRKPLIEIVSNTFPVVQEIATKLIQNYNDQSGILMSIVLKTFYAAIHLSVPDYFQQEVNFHVWLVFFKTIMDAKIPDELKVKTENEDEICKMSKHFYWKNIKWCGRILQRFIQKFGNTKWRNEKDTPAGQLFREKYSIPFLESSLGYLIRQKTEFVPSKVTLAVNKYLFYSLKIENTTATLLSHADKLIFDFLIPQCFLTKKDEEVWMNDPIEFIRKEEDFTNMEGNIKNSALDMIESISKLNDPASNSPFLFKIYSYISECLTKGVDPRNGQAVHMLLKESLMLILGNMKSAIMEDQNIKGSMEALLFSSLLPDFQNSIGFLRARVVWLFGKYSTLPWENEQVVLTIVQNIFTLLNDKDLPVQMKSAISLNCFMSRSVTQQLLKPSLSKLLELYLVLMNTMDSEEIVAALEGIIDNFNDEIIPFAKELIQHLSVAFMKMANKDNGETEFDDDEDFGEAEIAAGGVLETVKRILMINLPQQTYIETEPFFYPIFDFVFSDDGIDFLSEGISCFNLYMYKSNQISPTMWSYFPIICYSIMGIPDGVLNQTNLDVVTRTKYENVKSGNHLEYVDSVIGAIQNFISKGKDIFLTSNDHFGVPFYELIFTMITKVYSVGLRGSEEFDMICATTLLITLLENFPGKIDQLLPRIVGTALENMNAKSKFKQLKVINIQVIAIAIWYNPVGTIKILESQQATQGFFQTWFSLLPNFKKDFDKIRMLFGLSSILRIPQNELPQVILGSMPNLIKYIVKLTSEILELREKEVDSNVSEAEEDFNQEKDTKDFKKTLNKLNNFTNGEGAEDEDDDDEDYDELDDWQNDAAHFYDSPLEEIDEIIYLQSTLESLSANNQEYYNAIVGILDEQEKQTLSKNIETAKVQYQDYLQMKATEAQKGN